MNDHITSSAAETQVLAQEIALNLHGGDVLALFGDLGSGKTTFVQGLADAFGIGAKTQSPTFLLIRSHTLPKPIRDIQMLYHVDVYRLTEPIDIDAIGLREVMGAKDAVTVIEWAEKIENDLPKNTKRITFRYLDDEKREITSENF